MQKTKIFSVGLAIFAMLFGAGNVVFPLALGREVGDQVGFALLGLCITAVLVPLLGLVSSMLFDGDYRTFLGTMGTIPAAIVSFICMILIGPFGATPRCVTLSYAALKWHVPQLSLFVFSLIAAIIIFAATIKKSFVVDLLGRFLGPLKLILLLSVIIIGVFSPARPAFADLSSWDSFLQGFKEGYWTMDLLGTIFFSSLIISSIKLHKPEGTSREIALLGLKAGIIGSLILGFVYAGFCLVAAMHGKAIMDVGKDQILSALATYILGSKAGVLANITVAMACLTTAIALTAVFAEYLRREIFRSHIPYRFALAITVVAVFAMSNLGFSGIARVIEPIVVLFYPALIVLSLANIAYKLWGFKYIKTVTFGAFAATLVMQYCV